MSAASSPVVLDGVRKTFGSTVALDEVTLDVRAGELFGLVGPDGGGKTDRKSVV